MRTKFLLVLGVFAAMAGMLADSAPRDAQAGAPYFFEENFDGTSLDPARWAVSTNGYPSPAVSVGGGVVQMGQAGTTSQDFPYVSSLGTVFPATGNFRIELAVQYQGDTGFNGDGVVVLAPGNEACLCLWVGPAVHLKGKEELLVDGPTDQHLYRVDFIDGTAWLFVDGVLMQTGAMDARPTKLWFGHPTIGQILGLPGGGLAEGHIDPTTGEVLSRWWSTSMWSPFSIDYIRVTELPPVFTDDFNDNNTDYGFWNPTVTGSGATVQEVNQRVEVFIPSDSTGTSFGGWYFSTCTISGDFDIQVDYELLTWPSENGVRVALGSGLGSMQRTSFGPAEVPNEPREVYLTHFGDGVQGITGTANQFGKLRLVKAGSQVTGYSFSSGSWSVIHSLAGVGAADSGFDFGAFSNDFAFADQEVRVAFDNFTVNQGELVCPPSFRELAEYWAPVIYQDTDSANPDRDYITNFDFDGNWDGIDNWDNQPSATLNANVYYWVVETSTNWFIGYGIYHPRDWGVCFFQVGCHENDMEGVLLTIQRDGSSFGQFLLMNTQFHGGFKSYRDEDASPSRDVSMVSGDFDCDTRKPPIVGACLDVEFEGSSPIIYVEDKGHGITGAEGWELGNIGFPGGDGIVYRRTGSAEEPASGSEAEVGYALRDIQELWSRRCDFLGGTVEQAFASFGTFRGDDGYQDNKADAPWGWTDFFGPRPGFFLDPAKGISSNFGGLGSFSPSYSDASFSPGPNDSAEVSCMPIELGDGVSLTYEQVTGTGVTTNSTSSTGPLTPANYQPGTPAVYHDLLTTSTFSGSIEVCSDYDESTYELEEGIRLFHYDGQAWDDITTNLDTTNDRVCGVTLDLSPFHLAEIIPGQDLDGDGCTNGSELGFDPTLGGLRDYENPWDFYDVLGPGAALPADGVIDLPNDILGVILHFSPQGQALYDVNFDRGPSTGPNPWNMTAPDGVIDLPNDILGVILQFNHSCV